MGRRELKQLEDLDAIEMFVRMKGPVTSREVADMFLLDINKAWKQLNKLYPNVKEVGRVNHAVLWGAPGGGKTP